MHIKQKKSRFTAISIIIPAIIFLIFCMVIYPKDVFDASKTGISAWWNIVFPALLPFFISSELLMNYGVVQFMGVLLEPVMRPVFNLPGAASFVMAVGYSSGFPISASLTARLRKDRLCTKFEAERLMCFTNNASPLFMLVAVGVGMFGNPRLGVIIALVHYAANLMLGLLLRFYQTNDPEFIPRIERKDNILRRAFLEMHTVTQTNPLHFGKVLGSAISSSINKLLLIGGFVIIFSVIIRVTALTGIMSLITATLGIVLKPFGFSNAAVSALGQGFFEMTLGTKAVSEAVSVPLLHKAAAASIILGWSGLSVLAQVAAMIGETDLQMKLFVISRVFHGCLAGVICFIMFSLKPVLTWLAEPAAVMLYSGHPVSWWFSLCLSCRLCLYTLTIWFFTAMLIYIFRTFSIFRMHI
ncbi:sporulation integral membrane protein YlbJ [Phosphitispora sp. TUW77]|uniref:sporulation integral membrane protein YlbJ n=1 Tax=Phosphitispora sp. TUW77 TaxID=3152361 RepID=UPI003AB9101E